MIKKLQNIITVYYDKIQKSKYQQFTTDFIEEKYLDAFNEDLNEHGGSGSVQALTGCIQYEVDNILGIISDIPDRELFWGLKNELETFVNNPT